MKAIRTTICAYAIVLFANLFATTPLLAGSSDFAGIYVAARGAAVGAAVEGKYIDSNNEGSEGTGGRAIPMVGIDFGVNLPLGDTFFVTLGAEWAKTRHTIAKATDFENSADVELQMGNMMTWYVQPSISVTENSAIFVKYGTSEADLRAIGDVTGGPSNLDGYTLALGTTTLSNSGLYMKTEAGGSVFDEISITGIGGQADGKIHADPFLAYGAVSIGYKF